MQVNRKSKGKGSQNKRMEKKSEPSEKESEPSEREEDLQQIHGRLDVSEMRNNLPVVEDVLILKDCQEKENGKNHCKFDVWNVRFLEVQAYKEHRSCTWGDKKCHRDDSEESNDINAWIKR